MSLDSPEPQGGVQSQTPRGRYTEHQVVLTMALTMATYPERLGCTRLRSVLYGPESPSRRWREDEGLRAKPEGAAATRSLVTEGDTRAG